MDNFFATNRSQFETSLKGGVAVLTAYTGMQRGNDVSFAFEQEANFWWLTGIEEADWWLIADANRHKSWLVIPSISEAHRIFDGSLSPEQAKQISGVDEVITRDDAKSLLRDMARKHSVVRTLGEQPYEEYLNFSLNPAGKKMYEMLGRTFRSVQDCRKELAKMRAIKRPDEVNRMKKAISLTNAGLEHIKSTLDEYTYEYEVDAELTHYFRSRGKNQTWEPIVASGPNACTMHYMTNAAKLKKHSFLLMDIGVRYDGYTSDITRTYALGEPTRRQAEVHAAVQSVQRDVIRLIAPGFSIDQFQDESLRIMGKALIELGLIKDASDKESIYTFFPHAIGHGLGVDAHESLGGHIIQPGMVLTVEPGIYIQNEGIGVRIEDDILVTEKGHTNLSARLSTDW